METETVLFVAEVARRLRIGRDTVRTQCESGRFLGAYKTPAGHWRIPAATVKAIECGEIIVAALVRKPSKKIRTGKPLKNFRV